MAARPHGRLSRLLRFRFVIVPTVIVQMACFSHYATANWIQISPIGGPSMLPTLGTSGEWLVVDKTAHSGRNIVVGDLAVFASPIHGDDFSIKRVIGMPGDIVMLGTPEGGGRGDMIQVPKGHCYLVGDNLEMSRDSRLFGPVPLALIRGKPMYRLFPWAQRGWLSRPVSEGHPLRDPSHSAPVSSHTSGQVASGRRL